MTSHARGRSLQFGLEQVGVAIAHRADARGIARVGIAGRMQELGNDLGIGLAVEAHAREHRVVGADHLRHRGRDRAAAGAHGEQQRAIDVEQHQPATRHQPTRRAETNRCRSAAARVPSPHRSRTTSPHATVECTMVPSPA